MSKTIKFYISLSRQMNNKIILVDDNMFNKNIAEDFRNSYDFDVLFLKNNPGDIIETSVGENYSALILDSAMFPNGYFSQDQLHMFNRKFGHKSIDRNSFIPGTQTSFNNVVSNEDLMNVELGRNIGFGIYDEIRKQETEKQGNNGLIKRIPIMFYTVRDIKNLFTIGLLDPQNTFFIQKPEFTRVMAEKIKKNLSSIHGNRAKQNFPPLSNSQLN